MTNKKKKQKSQYTKLKNIIHEFFGESDDDLEPKCTLQICNMMHKLCIYTQRDNGYTTMVFLKSLDIRLDKRSRHVQSYLID